MTDFHGDDDVESVDEPRLLPHLLAQISALLAPAGLVALFCQVLDVSPQTTATYSLLTVAMMALLLYPHHINRAIPSAFALALMVILGAAFFFSYKNILLKNTGLIRFYHQSNDYLGELHDPIDRTKDEIWFFGTNFYISAGERRAAILSALERGVNVHYLIYDPSSKDFSRLARDFNQSEAELRAECDKGFISINELARSWSTMSAQTPTPGELHVRVFDVTPRGRVYVFDPGDEKGRTFLVPYVNNVNSSELPGFLLENIEAGVYKAYFAGVRKLWQTSRVVHLPVQPPA